MPSAAEINKGNGIIEDLQKEVRAAKSKTKIQTAVIKRQEALLEERLSSVNVAAGERAEASLEQRELAAANAALRDEKAALSQKLAESHALLQSNQQVIEWLNAELTDATAGRPVAAFASSAAPRSPLIDLSSPSPA